MKLAAENKHRKWRKIQVFPLNMTKTKPNYKVANEIFGKI